MFLWCGTFCLCRRGNCITALLRSPNRAMPGLMSRVLKCCGSKWTRYALFHFKLPNQDKSTSHPVFSSVWIALFTGFGLFKVDEVARWGPPVLISCLFAWCLHMPTPSFNSKKVNRSERRHLHVSPPCPGAGEGGSNNEEPTQSAGRQPQD